ncbi:MAG: hypothetical protein JO314_06285, partial [Acidobacteria bacterium]|nr:hypothetical protein [Acidobacteriota bacterium]
LTAPPARRSIALPDLLNLWIARKLLIASLALTFFWFGILKIAGVSPVVPLLKATFPFMASDPYLSLLGLFEVAAAAGLIISKLRRVTLAFVICHLIGTLSIIVIAPHVLFAPEFPVLTMEGEFVVKNLILISASLVLLLDTSDR